MSEPVSSEVLKMIADLEGVLNQPTEDQVKYLVCTQSMLSEHLAEVIGTLNVHTRILAKIAAHLGVVEL